MTQEMNLQQNINVMLKQCIRGDTMSSGYNWVRKHSQDLFEKYHGKHLAIVGEQIVAVGESAIEVFKKAKESNPTEKISITYIPTEEETVTLL